MGKDINMVIDRLIKLETKFDERWIAHDNQANDRQKATCAKLDEIKSGVEKLNNDFVCLDKSTCLMVSNVNERITKLPCEERKGLYNQVKIMWGVILLVIAAIVKEWIQRK